MVEFNNEIERILIGHPKTLWGSILADLFDAGIPIPFVNDISSGIRAWTFTDEYAVSQKFLDFIENEDLDGVVSKKVVHSKKELNDTLRGQLREVYSAQGYEGKELDRQVEKKLKEINEKLKIEAILQNGDFAVGLVPVVGDLLDFIFFTNTGIWILENEVWHEHPDEELKKLMEEYYGNKPYSNVKEENINKGKKTRKNNENIDKNKQKEKKSENANNLNLISTKQVEEVKKVLNGGEKIKEIAEKTESVAKDVVKKPLKEINKVVEK